MKLVKALSRRLNPTSMGIYSVAGNDFVLVRRASADLPLHRCLIQLFALRIVRHVRSHACAVRCAVACRRPTGPSRRPSSGRESCFLSLTAAS